MSEMISWFSDIASNSILLGALLVPTNPDRLTHGSEVRLGQKWIQFPPAIVALIDGRVSLELSVLCVFRLRRKTWPFVTSLEQQISDPRINDRIRVPEVRLVGPAGEQIGVVRIEEALRMAQEQDLDLVEVAPMSKPPVAKIMDFGKFKYEAAQKVREARKNQVNTVLKTVRFGLKIDAHDYSTKRGQIEKFLKAGDKVKVIVVFRGREQSRPEMGVKLLQKLAEEVNTLGAIESMPSIDGRNMVMVIGPLKNKAEAKAEAKRAAEKPAAQEPVAAEPTESTDSAE
jgi:translation initiation factor IF-3